VLTHRGQNRPPSPGEDPDGRLGRLGPRYSVEPLAVEGSESVECRNAQISSERSLDLVLAPVIGRADPDGRRSLLVFSSDGTIDLDFDPDSGDPNELIVERELRRRQVDRGDSRYKLPSGRVGLADPTSLAELVLTVRIDTNGIQFRRSEHPDIVVRDEALTVPTGRHITGS
jgi:hypothetical protein